MKPYHANPRKISERNLRRLRDSLEHLGDIGGIVENAASPEIAPNTAGQIVGGHQRLRAMFGEAAGEFAIDEARIEIVHRYEPPTEQGTVADGYIVWRGARFAYRRVVWDDETFRRANFAANQQAGEWDWDMFANTIDAQDLLKWDYDPAEWLTQLNRDAGAVRMLINASLGPAPGIEFDAWDGEGDGGGSYMSNGVRVRVVFGAQMFDIDDPTHEIYQKTKSIPQEVIKKALMGIIQ